MRPGWLAQSLTVHAAIARASLAETLLKLNTGLANIISSYLLVHERGPVTQLDYVSLLRLSEDSRKNAVAALGSLQQRLSSSRTLVAARNLEQEQSSRTKGKSVRGTKQKKSSSSQGAWVKKKPKRKTSSIASTAASTAGSTSTSAASSKSSTSKAPAASATAIVTQYLPPPRSTRHQFPSIQTKLAVKQSPTPPPSYDSHYYHQVFQQQAITAVAPVSGKGLVPGPRLNAQIRQITPSVYSFASDSTRLGEIPEYKIIRYDPTKYSALAEEYPVEKKAPTASVAPIPASLAGSSSGSEVAASSYGTNSAAGRKSKKFWGWNLFRKGTSQRGSDSGSVVVY